MARLVLYSDQVPPLTDPIDARLFAMLPPSGARIGYVPAGPDSDRDWFRDREAYYARHGARLEFFGLEIGFQPSGTADLLACDAIHLSGGNTFQFLYWLRRRGLIHDLQRYVANGGILIGVSAGAILMTPDVSSSSLCGDEPYPGLDDFTGLALVDFAVYPHYDESPSAAEALRRFSSTFDGTVYGVPDGGGIVVDGPRRELIGPIVEA